MVNTKVILVGVGGATCAGKTTLAKHLCKILLNSVIVHQDDFGPPLESFPIHPVYNVQDWDSPETAVDWHRFRQFLESVKQDGRIPPDYIRNDPFNEQRDFPVDAECYVKWKSHFEEVERRAREDHGIEIVWALVDGFLLYWDQESMGQLDIRIFLRVRHDTLRERRRERDNCIAGKITQRSKRSVKEKWLIVPFNICSTFHSHAFYHECSLVRTTDQSRSLSGAQSDLDGSGWLRDPPLYWEHIAWPGYVAAHKDMFENGDVESGRPTGDRTRGMVVLENEKMSTTEVVDQCCKEIAASLRALLQQGDSHYEA